MIKINKNLALFSGLFLFIGTILLFFLQKFSPLINHVTYYCKSFIETNMTPIPYYLSIIPIAFLLVTLAISFGKVLVLAVKVRLLKNTLKGKVVKQSKIGEFIKRLGLQEKTVVIKSPEYFAFCLGIRSPKMYLSTGLISHLSLKEIEAVLRHEQYHLENRDTFTMIIASVSHSLFPFFPLIGDLIKKYRIEREIQADRFAILKLQDSAPLLSALKKLLAYPTRESVALAAIADSDTLEPRIYSLVNKHYTKRQYRLKHLVITLFSSLVVALAIVLPVNAEEIHYEEHDVFMVCTNGECMNACTTDETMNKLYSELPH